MGTVLRDVGSVQFTGYEHERGQAPVVAILRGGASVGEATKGEAVEVVTSTTPFYGEAGGQVGDQGEIQGPEGRIRIDDTQKPLEGLIVHRGSVTEGTLRVGQRVDLEVDHERRSATRRNHSATHLLHWALREVLGRHAEQKGSLVAPDRLRFDYSHFSQPSTDELLDIEQRVNEKVLRNAPVETEVRSMEEAVAAGAMAIFEEKYGDVVRVVRITEDSTELCGGTHAARSGDIGLFKIVSEGSVAAGVRRIEALTGMGALEWVRQVESELRGTARLLRGAPMEAIGAVTRLLEREKELQRELSAAKRKLAAASTDDLMGSAREVDGFQALGARTEVSDPAALRELADKLRDRLGKGIVLLAAENGGKVSLVITVTKDLTPRLHAGKLIRDVAAAVGGSGGGRPDMAQAGGSNPSGIDDAIRVFHEAVARLGTAPEGSTG